MILVGTSGFHFDDWKHVFYPSHLKKSEWLEWYVRHFPTLEINSTYYRIPAPTTFESMERRTPAGYPIVVKAHGDVTHTREDPAGSIDRLLTSAESIIRSGKLVALLAQFPWNFRASSGNRRYLSRVRSSVPDEIPLFAEFRHESWAVAETIPFLRDTGIGFCAVDEPDLHSLMPRIVAETNGIGYIRFHGRNGDAWWKGSGEGKGDRYDYEYAEEELREWVENIRKLHEKTEKTYIYFNNCYAGQAVRGAKLMQTMLDLPRTGEEQPGLGF